MSNAAVSSIYVVRIGDTLPKLAQQFYGDESRATLIAQANGLRINDVLAYGKRLQIPSASVPGTALLNQDGTEGSTTTLEEIAVTAPARSAWYKDWRIWAAVAAAGGLVWMLSNTRKRK